jgi:repressor LexA
MVRNAESQADLSQIQHEILRVIRRLTLSNGYSPCMREVLPEVRLQSTSALSYQYNELTSKGYLRRKPRQPRTVEVRLPDEPPFSLDSGEPAPSAGPGPPDDRSVIPNREKVAWVPIVGRIAAGLPVLAQELIEDYFPMPTDVVGREEGLFILEVAGDSMTGAGIIPGDWVVVRPLFQSPQNGDIVAAIIEGAELECTVKTYRKVDRRVWLMPQNTAYTPIPGGKARIAGKVVAVLRRV